MASTYEADLIRRARELQRLVTKRNRLRRNLRTVEADIKTARKALRAVRQASEGRRPDIAPSRLHAGVTAIGLMHPEKDVNDGLPHSRGSVSEPRGVLLLDE